MKNQHYRYSLDNSKPTKLFTCPSCGKKQLKRYVDSETNTYLEDYVGRCNRQVNCMYHFKPSHYFSSTISSKKVSNDYIHNAAPTHFKQIDSGFSSISAAFLKKSLESDHPNFFYEFLTKIFDNKIAFSLMQKFQVGTAKHYLGANVFWQIDEKLDIRTGKIMLYDPISGKRIKDKNPTWVHAQLHLTDFKLSQCLFGLHQIKYESINKPIAIVESEKTAILMTVVYPKFIWMATGGKSFSYDKIKEIAHRKITLFPDLNCYDDWLNKAMEFNKNGLEIKVSDFLELNATEEQKKNGLDLADFFIHDRIDEQYGVALTENDYPLSWDYTIENFNQK